MVVVVFLSADLEGLHETALIRVQTRSAILSTTLLRLTVNNCESVAEKKQEASRNLLKLFYDLLSSSYVDNSIKKLRVYNAGKRQKFTTKRLKCCITAR